MNEQEPDLRDFFRRIVRSFFFGSLWMIANMTMGIYFDLLFIRGTITIGNIAFYLFFIISLLLLLRFFYKTWTKKFPHG